MEKYDLVIIGGGLAGVCAGISASRQGARTLIVERSGCLGGASTNGLVTPFMPYWTEINKERVPLCGGIFAEICDRLRSKGAMLWESFSEEILKELLNDMTLESGAELLFHATLFKVNRDKNRILSVDVAVKSGILNIEADYFIDASGDALLTYLADCPTVQGRKSDGLCQPMTLCFRLGNVDTDAFFRSWKELDRAYKSARECGEITNPRENILVFRTPVHNVLHFNSTRVIKLNPTSPFDITRAEITARKQVGELYEFMKKHAQGLENSFILATASEIGVRESRRIIGDYVLTQDDCKGCAKFEDAIACCNYDIDIHNPEGSGTSHYYFGAGEYYTIPYRALIPQGVDNLLVAGRCISSDHEAQASYRIMPVVACLGEAAGTAMAIAIRGKDSVREISVSELQGTLRKNGAIIKI